MTSPSNLESANPNKDMGTSVLAVPPLNVISTKAIRPEIQAFWQALSAKDTVNAFVNLFRVLWNLLLRLATVFSLLLLFFAVIVVWFWSISYQSGRAFRQIFVTDNDELGGPQIVNGLARLFLIPVKALAGWVTYQLKKQFGRDFEVPLPDLTSQVWPYSASVSKDTVVLNDTAGAAKTEPETEIEEPEASPISEGTPVSDSPG